MLQGFVRGVVCVLYYSSRYNHFADHTWQRQWHTLSARKRELTTCGQTVLRRLPLKLFKILSIFCIFTTQCGLLTFFIKCLEAVIRYLSVLNTHLIRSTFVLPSCLYILTSYCLTTHTVYCCVISISFCPVQSQVWGTYRLWCSLGTAWRSVTTLVSSPVSWTDSAWTPRPTHTHRDTHATCSFAKHVSSRALNRYTHTHTHTYTKPQD